jgi:zinc protease
MNYPLGGAFNSRINLNLREKHGYTYGARTNFRGTTYLGTFLGNAGVKKEFTDKSVTEFLNEIKTYSTDGPTEEEVEFTKNSFMYGEVLKYLTLSQKNGYLKMIKDYNLPNDLPMRQSFVLHNFTRSTGMKLAQKFLPVSQMVILVVGDKKVILPQLETLGKKIIELDKEGNLINP